MKKEFIFFVLIIFLPLMFYSCSKEKICKVYHYKYNSGKLDINSKWKEYKYKYDENGNKIEELKYESTGWVASKYKYLYDNKGNKIEEEQYNGNDSIISVDLYRYDDYGNKIDEVINSYDNVVWKDTYKYYDKGNKIERIRYNYKDSTLWKNLYTYNDKKYIGEEVLHNPDGTVWLKVTYKYDENRNVIEKVQSFSDRELNIIYSDGSDSKGNDFHHIKILQGDSVWWKYIYTYDPNGNMFKEVKYNKKNEPVEKTEYIYSK